MSGYVAIVEDEQDIADLIQFNLEKSGFRVKTFERASKLLSDIEKIRPDLLILDVMLPDMDGFELCRQIRKNRDTENIPIVMVTAKAEETDKILGLEFGADDYITKPFSPRELVARVKAIMRRSMREVQDRKIVISQVLVIDEDQYRVTVEGKAVELTQSEFKILALLAKRAGMVFTREQILDHIWGYEKAVIDRTIDVHIKHLRDKLGEAGSLIINVRGVGYKIER